ncbi:hypothetical protein HZC34_00050 [Candidatus Saganbacteria bacterium]|nr:hypothetical protein [Candidatus Saganbacteria bacterium]
MTTFLVVFPALGGLANGISSAVNPPKIEVSASNCSIELCTLPKIRGKEFLELKITGENVDFQKHPPMIDLPKESGLKFVGARPISKDAAIAVISLVNAHPGFWDVGISGFVFKSAIVVGRK